VNSFTSIRKVVVFVLMVDLMYVHGTKTAIPEPSVYR
jgi:hypothetical protein